MRRSSRAPTRPRVRALSWTWMLRISERANSSSLVTERRPTLGGPFGREVLAPGDDRHIKGYAHPGDLRTQPSQAQNSQDFPLKTHADRDAPVSSPCGGILARNVA